MSRAVAMLLTCPGRGRRPEGQEGARHTALLLLLLLLRKLGFCCFIGRTKRPRHPRKRQRTRDCSLPACCPGVTTFSCCEG